MPARAEAIRRLLELQVPIRCRSLEEQVGVERWRAAAPALVARAEEVFATGVEVDHLEDTYRCAREEGVSYRQIELAGRVMDQVRAREGDEKAIEGVWQVITVFTVHLWRQRVTSILEDPNVDLERIGRYFRHFLVDWEFTALSATALAHHRIATAALRSLSDAELGALHCPPDRELLAELVGSTEAECVRHFIDPGLRERARARSAELSAEAERTKGDAQRVRAKLEQDLTGLAGEIQAARELLPGSGETADLDELFARIHASIVPALGQSPPPEPNLGRPNILLGRLTLCFTLHGIQWSRENRGVLRELIVHPRNFARFDPRSSTGLAVKRRLRPLQRTITGPRLAHEYDSLLAAIDNPEATDQEIVWVLSEYVLSHLEPEHATLLADRLLLSLRSLTEERDLAGWLRLLGNISVYEGQARLKTAVDAEIERLEAEEAAAPKVDGAPRPFRPYQRVAAPPTPLPTVEICYIPNPESPTPHRESVKCTAPAAYQTILGLLEQHARTPEPNRSLAKAAYRHLFLLPEEHRQTWKKERVGSFVFHKLKRGAARMWVRRDGDTVLMHAYCRRDWSKQS